MKKSLALIIAIIAMLPASAQEFAILNVSDVNGVSMVLSVDDIDRIAYEKDSENEVVLTIYMKDGTVCRGMKDDKHTCLGFFDWVPFDTPVTITTDYLNGYQVTWNVNGVGRKDGCYSVGILWYDMEFAHMANERHGICIGTAPNLSIENSEHVLFVDDSIEHLNCPKLDHFAHYMFVGPKVSLPRSLLVQPSVRASHGEWDYNANPYSLTSSGIDNSYMSDLIIGNGNWLDIPLEYGKTYYYRTFSQCDGWLQGEVKPMTFYDVEKSFRVPYVMEDAGYDGKVQPTEEAFEKFKSHFPDSVTAPTWEQLKHLWDEWRLTDDGKQTDISVYYVTPETFDNGTVSNQINRIPDEFYTWLCRREIVIDSYEGITEIGKVWIPTWGDSIEVATPEVVYPDDSFHVPGGKYVCFKPKISNTDIDVTYRSNEVIPGIQYRLQVNFAPDCEENSEGWLPTIVDISILPMGDAKDSSEGRQLFYSQEIPSTDVTTLESDNVSTKAMGMDLWIKTNVSKEDYRSWKYNRIMRIAEIRLIPTFL